MATIKDKIKKIGTTDRTLAALDLSTVNMLGLRSRHHSVVSGDDERYAIVRNDGRVHASGLCKEEAVYQMLLLRKWD